MTGAFLLTLVRIIKDQFKELKRPSLVEGLLVSGFFFRI